MRPVLSEVGRVSRTRTAAAHEAGHAVAAVVLGLCLERVALTPGQEYYGFTQVRCPKTKRYEVGVMFASGAAADHLAKAGDWGSEEDRKLVLGAGFSRRDWLHLEALARSLLRRHKAPWLAVTDALLLSDLTGAQVRRIVKRYS